MAYVHMSVNQTSKEYLANERRYNYTTPKSFLEQIKLYRSLLGQRSKELTTKMERLESGLQKLSSTSAQVLTFQATPEMLLFYSPICLFIYLFRTADLFSLFRCLCSTIPNLQP